MVLNFKVIKNADNGRYGDGHDIRLVILRPKALFSGFKLTTSSGKHLEDVVHTHIISLRYKLKSTAKVINHLSLGFGQSRNRRRDELTSNENTKSKYHFRTKLKGVFGFAQHQEKATYGLGYKKPLTRNKDDAVIDKGAGIPDARIKLDHIYWYVPHYIPSIQQQSFLSKPILNKTPTELRYFQQSVFMGEVNNQNLWNFELGSQENMNVAIWNIIGIQRRYIPDPPNLNNDTFCRLPVISAQFIIGTQKHPNGGISVKYDVDDDSQGYTQIKEVFRGLAKDDLLKPFISEQYFRSSNVRVDMLFIIYKFPIKDISKIFQLPN